MVKGSMAKGACKAKGGMHSGGPAWQGACVVGACMAGGHVWQGGVWQGRSMHRRRDGHCSGQYAYYWNVFLFNDEFTQSQ